MTKQLSRKAAALWLSEARGRDDIRPAHVRHIGNWLFFHDPKYPTEVECIYAPKSGDIWAEPWDDIPFADSPFCEKDSEKLAETLEKLDRASGNAVL